LVGPRSGQEGYPPTPRNRPGSGPRSWVDPPVARSEEMYASGMAPGRADPSQDRTRAGLRLAGDLGSGRHPRRGPASGGEPGDGRPSGRAGRSPSASASGCSSISSGSRRTTAVASRPTRCSPTTWSSTGSGDCVTSACSTESTASPTATSPCRPSSSASEPSGSRCCTVRAASSTPAARTRSARGTPSCTGSPGTWSTRPSALFLTGDQIYADDVAGPLARHLTALGREMLGRADDIPGLPPVEEIPVWGRKELVQGARLLHRPLLLEPPDRARRVPGDVRPLVERTELARASAVRRRARSRWPEPARVPPPAPQAATCARTQRARRSPASAGCSPTRRHT
jgi:hypothetical protein